MTAVLTDSAIPAGTATATTLSTLRDLLALTPPSPHADTEPHDVMQQAQAICEAREPLLQQLKSLIAAGAPFGNAEAELRNEIAGRDSGWEAALTRVRYRLRERRAAASNLRRRGYQR